MGEKHHPNQTTYAKAVREYDADHERAILEAVTTAIFETSMVSDANAAIFRTGEIAQALTTALACTLVMSPSATHSPTATRKTVDAFSKRLRRRIFSAKQSDDLQDFMRGAFNGNGPEGNA